MAWQLQGRYFENCSCDMVCPCTTSGLTMPADYDRCRVVLVFHVDAGAVEDVDVSNLTVAVLADTPPLMADGNWRVGVFMDAAASQEQAEKLGGGLRRAARRPHGHARPADQRDARGPERPDRVC